MSKHDSPNPANSSTDISRRKFIKSAASGGAAIAVSSSMAVEALPVNKKVSSPSKDRFDDILRLSGSEFGDIRKTN